jgi:hypothetical protein
MAAGRAKAQLVARRKQTVRLGGKTQIYRGYDWIEMSISR